MISTILFVAIAVLLCAAALLAILGVGHLALSGVEAIERDGLARGRLAPAWSLTDSAGVVRRSPPARPLQLIVFADHSLKSFPSVVAGLRALLGDPAELPVPAGPGPPADGVAARSAASLPEYLDPADLEIVVLTRGPSAIAEPVLGQLGLGGIPVLTGSPARYADYNVRVIPFAIFVDSAGLVRASSLVNHDWQLAKLRQLAAIALDPGELENARAGGNGRKLARKLAAGRRDAAQPSPQRLPRPAV